MAELFGKDVKTISKHSNNIFKSEELVKKEVSFNPNNSTNSRILIISPNSKKQPILYNLDAIISVGYRVNSKQATHFRRWATNILKEYILQSDVVISKNYLNHALSEYKEFRVIQDRDYQSDFDKMIIDVRKIEFN